MHHPDRDRRPGRWLLLSPNVDYLPTLRPGLQHPHRPSNGCTPGRLRGPVLRRGHVRPVGNDRRGPPHRSLPFPRRERPCGGGDRDSADARRRPRRLNSCKRAGALATVHLGRRPLRSVREWPNGRVRGRRPAGARRRVHGGCDRVQPVVQRRSHHLPRRRRRVVRDGSVRW